MAKREPTMDEIRKVALATANEDTVIVGGMAVSVLAEIYEVTGDAPCMTKDADFLGGLIAIEHSAEQVSSMWPFRKYLATMDDAGSPNSGKLAIDVDPNVEPVEIDFLFRIDGLSTDEIETKAMSLTIDGKPVRVMHPILLLENKVNNLGLYPDKRNAAGVNQARLAIEIGNQYLQQTFNDEVKKNPDQRLALQITERIARVAERDPACFAYKAFGLDILAAIPVDLIVSADFQQVRWPQIKSQVAAKRERFDRIWDRISKTQDPKRARFRV